MVYYIFLIVEAISLYFNEFGFDLTYGIMVSFGQVASTINFGIFIALILTTADLLKEKNPISKMFKFGLVMSLIFGGLIFLLSDKVVPELRMTTFLNRYENARKEAFSSQERADKTKEFKKTNADMMSIGLINHYSDSLENENISQKKIIDDLLRKIPDSIIQSDFSKKELNEYDIPKNNLITEFNRRDLFKLQTEIRKNKVLTKQLKKSNWKKNERFINSLLTLFLVCFGVVIGANFKNQNTFSLVCIGIVIYSYTLTLLAAMTDYFIDEKNLIGLIFKLTIILIVFLYLIYRISIKKNTGANTV
ncbi:hypothetical protein [Yeosuana marina]|uniref:hypothetical protein n=1 Tax=Yeosuana marina TaxID=1565536 RepID=UPI00141F3657|nr:hypothetical protein [Yeosuana marina]